MAYLTYDEYKELGGTLDETEFTMCEMKSRKRIDRMTDSRVQAMENIPTCVKYCIAELIGIESKSGYTARANNDVVASFNTDGYSQSFAGLSIDDTENAMDSIVRFYLYGEKDDNGVVLLYRGVR